MSEMVRRTPRGANLGSAKPEKPGIGILTSGFGAEFDAIFAVCVLLGALWLLMSGYA